MAHIVADRVKETTSTTGTGSFTLTGAVSAFRTFASQMATSDTTWYCAVNGTEWEVGLGTLTGSTTLARTTLLASSTGSAVSFTAAPVVFETVPATGFSGRRLAQMVKLQTGTSASGSTIFPVGAAIPQNSHGDQYLSLGITPVSAVSELEIDIYISMSGNVAAWHAVGLFRDAIANTLGAAISYSATGGTGPYICFKVTVASGSTAATVFKVRAGLHVAGTTTINTVFAGGMVSGITIKEWLL